MQTNGPKWLVGPGVSYVTVVCKADCALVLVSQCVLSPAPKATCLSSSYCYASRYGDPDTNLVMTIDQLSPKTIFVVSGPAASGKTTVGTYLSQELGIPYIEGDDVRSILWIWLIWNFC